MTFETWTLEEAGIRLIDGDRGKNYPKQSEFSNNGYCLFLSAKNVTSSGFQFSEPVFIGKDRHELLRAGTLERGDIVMTTRGTIGNFAFYDSTVSYPVVRINSGMIIFRADLSLWNPRFLYYVLTSSIIQEKAISLTSGSAVPQLPARDLKQFELPKIPLDVQNKIESIISSITDKISTNQQINQTLEQMAQAIFKSWFVDFEPVKAKIAALEAGGSEEDANLAAMQAISGKTLAELQQLKTENLDHYQQLYATAKHFPTAMKESELGKIPEGWKTGTLAELCQLNPENWNAKTLPESVRYVDLSGTKNGELIEVRILSGKEIPSRARRILRCGDTIIGTVRPGNRSFALIAEQDLTASTGFAVLRASAQEQVEFIYLAATSDSNIERLAHLADGGAYPAVRPEVVTQENIVIPDDEVLEVFHQHVQPLFLKISSNKNQSIGLTEIRNVLLPKLLSGELSVENLES